MDSASHDCKIYWTFCFLYLATLCLLPQSAILHQRLLCVLVRSNFDSLGETLVKFVDTLKLDKYAMDVFDYGAPTDSMLMVLKMKSCCHLKTII